MKRFALVFLAVIFVFMLTGCTYEKELYCYDATYSVEMTYDKEGFISIVETDLGVETEFSDARLLETTDIMKEFYEGEDFHEVMLNFIDEAESEGATCELKNR